MGGDNNPFPHDGKQGRCGCGQGYSWNDDNYGRHSGGSSGGGSGNGTAIFLIALVICSIIGAFNQLLGGLIFLAVIIDNKIMSKSEIISYLDFFINQRSSIPRMEVAISKWEADRDFVENYKIGHYIQFGVKAIYRK